MLPIPTLANSRANEKSSARQRNPADFTTTFLIHNELCPTIARNSGIVKTTPTIATETIVRRYPAVCAIGVAETGDSPNSAGAETPNEIIVTAKTKLTMRISMITMSFAMMPNVPKYLHYRDSLP